MFPEEGSQEGPAEGHSWALGPTPGRSACVLRSTAAPSVWLSMLSQPWSALPALPTIKMIFGLPAAVGCSLPTRPAPPVCLPPGPPVGSCLTGAHRLWTRSPFIGEGSEHQFQDSSLPGGHCLGRWQGRQASTWARQGLNLTTEEAAYHTELPILHLRAPGSLGSPLAGCKCCSATPPASPCPGGLHRPTQAPVFTVAHWRPSR